MMNEINLNLIIRKIIQQAKVTEVTDSVTWRRHMYLNLLVWIRTKKTNKEKLDNVWYTAPSIVTSVSTKLKFSDMIKWASMKYKRVLGWWAII